MSKVAYTTKEASAAASVSHHAILYAIKTGLLVSHLVDGRHIVEATDLTEWVRSRPTR